MKNKKSKTAKEKDKNLDLLIEFKNCKIDVMCDEEIVSLETAKKVKNAIEIFSKHIIIDKTYVNYPTTKFEKVFLTYDGWKELKNLIYLHFFLKKSTPTLKLILFESFKVMITTFLYQCLSDLDIDVEGIYLKLDEDCKFMTIVQNINVDYVDLYSGKWLTWK